MSNQFVDPDLPTLADVAKQIKEAQSLSAARKAGILSAVKTAARWFNLAASAVPAHPDFLRRSFVGFAPAAAGVTANVFQT